MINAFYWTPHLLMFSLLIVGYPFDAFLGFIQYGPLNWVLKDLFGTVMDAEWAMRPNGIEPGFPSGHMQGMASLSLSIARIYGERWLWALAPLTLVVATQRYTAERHTVVQLIGGLLIGFGVHAFLNSSYCRLMIPSHLLSYSAHGY